MRITKKKRKHKKKLQMQNKRLIKKYYWLMPHNVWTGKPLDDYDYTYIEWGWCQGWDKAFGQMFMDELGAAIKNAGQKNYQIVQIKEKFGQLRLYDNGSTKEVHEIISKYEIISEHVCMLCGREAPMINDGWMQPMCLDCFIKGYRRREKWKIERDSNYIPKTDEEIKLIYENVVCDDLDEDGKYHIPKSYTIRRFNESGATLETRDISDTVKKIQYRISKYKTHGGK